MASHVRTIIRYDGPALSTHEMDVQDLAPALLALAEIVQIANKKFNDGQAEMRVLVNADVEQKCFMIELSLVQSLLEQARGFFGHEDVKTAKDIAEWIGLIGGGAVGLFGLLKFIRNKPEGGTTIKVEQPTGTTTITVINGSGEALTVPLQTYELAQDKAVVERAKAVVKPLEKPGYESLAFLEGDREVFDITDEEAADLVEMPLPTLDPVPSESVSRIKGVVRIKSAQYEGAAKWSFMWNGRAIDAEMVEQAAEWVQGFQSNAFDAPPNTVLEVSMTETVRVDERGVAVSKPTYAIQQVHSTTPPPRQEQLV
ncbi:MAG: hypothetical protein K2X31_03260 [Sphingopyxis sp.]|jgi:hypothetical protein|nr:hypothetical protein [Sphingopyxis sp.]